MEAPGNGRWSRGAEKDRRVNGILLVKSGAEQWWGVCPVVAMLEMMLPLATAGGAYLIIFAECVPDRQFGRAVSDG